MKTSSNAAHSAFNDEFRRWAGAAGGVRCVATGDALRWRIKVPGVDAGGDFRHAVLAGRFDRLENVGPGSRRRVGDEGGCGAAGNDETRMTKSGAPTHCPPLRHFV